jgi:hypothetical protein
MTHVFIDRSAMIIPVAVGGRGVMLFDRDGKSYIDA